MGMKLTISKVKAKAPKKKEEKKRRLSEKEIALRWLDEQLQMIIDRSKTIAVETLTDTYTDGRKIKEQHIDRMRSLVKNRVDRYRAPILTLFTKRDIEPVIPL